MDVDVEDLAISLGFKTQLGDLLIEQCKLAHGKLVLEAGCGTGKFSLNLVMRARVFATLVDSDLSALQRSLRHLKAVEALTDQRLPVVLEQQDITKLPYRDRLFDLVFNEGVIEHFKDPTVPLKEMARVSRDYVAAIVPNAENAKQLELARRQTEQYAGKAHWAAYEKPMTTDELSGYMSQVGLSEVKTLFVWRDTSDADPKSYQYRLIMSSGRVPQ